jgi:DASH complex subunit DAD3
MGLVLTLFKASVWSLIQTHQDELEEEEQRQRQDDDATNFSNYPIEGEDTITHQDYAY